MKINPFKALWFDRLLVFPSKKKKMYLKQYILRDIADIGKIMDEFEKMPDIFQERSYCLEINYQDGKISTIFSFSFFTSDVSLDIKVIQEKIEKTEKMISGKYLSIHNPLGEYLSLFRNASEFKLFFDGNEAHLLTENKQEIEIQSFYRIKFTSSNIKTNIFKFLDDLGRKLKNNLKITFFIANNGDSILLDSVLICACRNRGELNDLNGKFEKIVDLDEMLEKLKLKRELFGSFLIRRPLYLGKIEEVIPFEGLIKDKKIPSIISEKRNKSEETVDEKQNRREEILPLNSKIINRLEKHEFHIILSSIYKENGKFIDSNKNIFDTGKVLIMLIYGLNLKFLNQMIKNYMGKRFFNMVFVDWQEYQEFTSKVPNRKEGVYEVTSFQDFKNHYLIIDETVTN